ncbi:hypothetical protein [Pseudokineococcus marinus]|uniref:Uncharacterized protein n=1 Tax=Pseudokineococcus marinus TaxID=351215 RepID=A0A849BQQ9_9ACTN|nr:hypothetical protein [Pseudokineococcus marinus]NNH21876.1 hypothetical protein [Pseudokineococcus marinus]
MSTTRPTPADLRELAAAADDLATRIRAVQAALRAEDSGARSRAGFRLDEAAGQARQVSAALEDTAGELARIAATPDLACGIEWGVCPLHGDTITTSGGRSWCTATGCTRTWGYDRLSTPCPEPVTHRLRDTDGQTQDVCNGHAIGARARITGVTVDPIT